MTAPSRGDGPRRAERAAAQFTKAALVAVTPLGRGHINDTFLVATETGRFVLQRLNRGVFPDPVAIMANVRILCDHWRGHSRADLLRLPQLIRTLAGEDYHRDEEEGFWRALSYLDGSRTLDRLADRPQAEQVGAALGRFHALVADLDPGHLYPALPGFHIAPQYLAQLDALLAHRGPVPESAELRAALEFVEARRPAIEVLEQAKQQGQLQARVIHGDPKLDNVLFDGAGRRALGMIDLDTVQPGLILYDLGDCLRSCCNPRGETPADGAVRFDADLCEAILRGYLAEARGLLSAADVAYLYDAIRLLPLELGLRFLADHLAGDRYFKVSFRGQNLHRAQVQFQLTFSVERQERRLRRLLDGLA